MSDVDVKRMEEKGDVEGLMEVLKSGDSTAQNSAAIALGKMGDARAIEPLVQALKDRFGSLRTFSAISLEKLGWEPRNDAEKVHYFIAKGWYGRLEEVGPTAVEALIHHLKDLNQVVRRDAAHVLAKLRDERSIEPFIELLGFKSYPRARSWACHGLTLMGKPALGPLRQALKATEREWMKKGDLDIYDKLTHIKNIIELIEQNKYYL